MRFWILPLLIVTTLSFNNSAELTAFNPISDNLWSIVNKTDKSNPLVESLYAHYKKSIKRHQNDVKIIKIKV